MFTWALWSLSADHAAKRDIKQYYTKLAYARNEVNRLDCFIKRKHNAQQKSP